MVKPTGTNRDDPADALICGTQKQSAYVVVSGSNSGKKVETSDSWVKSRLKTGKANTVKGQVWEQGT